MDKQAVHRSFTCLTSSIHSLLGTAEHQQRLQQVVLAADVP